jgi:hypothetical protein
MKTKSFPIFTAALNAATGAINAASGVFQELALPANASGETSFRYRLSPYGEFPVDDIHGNAIIQVVDRQAGATLAANYGSLVGKLATFFRGVPIYEGHADDAAWREKNPGHRASAVGRIKSIEVEDDGIWVTSVLNSDGTALLDGDAPKYTGHSPYWRLSEIPGRAGYFRPILLWSDALTNTPNIMHNTIALNGLEGMPDDLPSPDAASGESENQETTTDMPLTPEALQALGFAPDAAPTAEEISAAIVKMLGDMASAEADKAAAMETVTAANSRLSLVETELHLVRGTAVETVLAEALNTGRITAADKPAWTAALNTSFATESAKLQTLMPVLNTSNRVAHLGTRRDANHSDAANAAERITQGVIAFAAEKAIDITTAPGWTKAYDACRVAKPELFTKA